MVDFANMSVENRVKDAVLTVIDNVLIPRGEMAVRSFTVSSGRGPSSVVQNANSRDFIESTGNNRTFRPLANKNKHRFRQISLKSSNSKLLRMAFFRHWDLNMTGERILITWWQVITPRKKVSLTFSRDELQLKTIRCHSNLTNHKTWQHTFLPKTHYQWFNNHQRFKFHTQAIQSTDMLRRHYSRQQQPTR